LAEEGRPITMTIDEQRGTLETSGPSPVQSLSRGLGILGQFSADSSSLSLAELSRRTGLHRATVYRFIKTLEIEGYVVFDPASSLYSVGPAWAMALYALGNDTVFAQILSADIGALAESSLETVALGVRRGENVQVVHAQPPSRGFVPKLPASRLHPLHATWNVHSQILLAFSSEETKKRMLAVQPTRFTEHTVVDPAAVRTRLERVTAEAVAFDREECNIGTCAVAVPLMIRDKVVAALALVVPVERFTDDAVPSFVDQLRVAAHAMEKRLDAPNSG
jgi:IclR family transcriptional regulator, acetate operon repressor